MDKDMIFMLHLCEEAQKEGWCVMTCHLSDEAKADARRWESEGYTIGKEEFKMLISGLILNGDVSVTATGQGFGPN